MIFVYYFFMILPKIFVKFIIIAELVCDEYMPEKVLACFQIEFEIVLSLGIFVVFLLIVKDFA